MEQQEFRQSMIGGWSTDMTPQYQAKDTVIEIENMRIINKGGNHYVAESYDGTSIMFSLDENYIPLNFTSVGKDLVVFATMTNEVAIGRGVIYYVDVITVGKIGYPTMLMISDEINFSIENIIRTKQIQENDVNKVYFWDNRTEMKVANISDMLDARINRQVNSGDLVVGKKYMVVSGDVDHDGTSYGAQQATAVFVATITTYSGTGTVLEYYSIEMMSCFPKPSYGAIDYVETILGSLTCGNYFFTARCCDKYGNGGRWCVPSPAMLITSDVGPANQDFGKYYQAYQGKENSTISTKGLRLQLYGFDNRYSHIQVAYIKCADEINYDTPVVFAFEEIANQSDFTIDFVSNDTVVDKFDLSELIADVFPIIRNRDADAVKNELVIGNYEVFVDTDADLSSGLSVTEVYRNIPLDIQPIYKNSGRDNTDIPDDDSANDLFQSQYAYQDGVPENTTRSIEYFAEGFHYLSEGGTVDVCDSGGTFIRNIVDGEIFVAANGEAIYKVSSGTPKVYPVVVLNLYGGIQKVIKIKSDWLDYKGTAVSAYYKSHWRSETYRYAIVFTKGGIPFYAHHLVDHKYSSLADSDLTFRGVGDRRLYGRSIGINIDNIDFNKIIDSLRIIYNDATITYDDLPKYFDSCFIVRADRDAQILAEGLIFPVMEKIGSGAFPDDYSILSSAAPIHDWRYNENGNKLKKDCYAMYSPDQRFGFENHHGIVDGDKIRVEKFFNISALIPLQGTPWNDYYDDGDSFDFIDWYQRYYVELFLNPDEYVSGVQIGSEVDIDIDFAGPVSISEEKQIEADGKRLVGWNMLRGDYITPYFQNPDGSDLAFGSHEYVGVNNSYTLIKTKDNDNRYPNGLTDETVPEVIARMYVSYLRKKGALYGGESNVAKQNTAYYNVCNHFKIDDAFINYLKTTDGFVSGVEIFGGDTFISLFDYMRHYGNKKRWDHIYHNNNPMHSQTVIFPVQTKINVGMRQGRHAAKDLAFSSFQTGIFPSPITINEYHTDGICFPGTSSPDQKEKLVYNFAYSNDILRAYPVVSLPVNFIPSRFRNKSLIPSNKKTDGETKDSWKVFPASREFTMANDMGVVIAVRTKNDVLHVFQEDAVYYVPVEERVLLSNSLNMATTIGAKSSIDRFDALDTTRGCQHTHGIGEFQQGFIYFDAKRRDMCIMVGGKITSLAVANKNIAFFQNQMFGDFVLNDKPIAGAGITAGYNDKLKHVYLCFVGRQNSDGDNVSDLTIVYDVLNNQFSGKLIDAPGLIYDHDGLTLTIRPSKQFVQATFYYKGTRVLDHDGKTYVAINNNTVVDTNPGALQSNTNWGLVNTPNQVWLMDNGPVCHLWGFVYHNRIGVIVNPEVGVSQIFENMVADTAGNKFFFDIATYKNSFQNKSEFIKKPHYIFVDRSFEWSVPFDVRKERFTDKYLYVEFFKDNRLLERYYESKNEKTSLLELKTMFKKAY